MPLHRAATLAAGAVEDAETPTIDLRHRAQDLRARPEWRSGDTTSALLVRDGDLRIALSTLRRGARLGADVTEGPVALVLVEGTAVATRDGRTVRMKPGELALIHPDRGWALVAEHDDALVLSVFCQPSAPADIGADLEDPGSDEREPRGARR